MKKRFYPMLVACLFLSGLILGATTSSAYIPEPNCVCASCDRPCGSGHAPNCPYDGGGGGGGDDSERSGGGGASFERAPIFVAPVGMVGGVFAGGVWYFKQMAGSLKEDFFIDSYQNFLNVPDSDEYASGAFTFGLRMGALPWMALYVPTGPIRYGVVSAYKAATKPSPPKPKPVDPNIAVYDLIAQNYAGLSKTTDEELKKAQGNVETAMMRRTRMLDDHIEGSQELREIREKEGIAAARARAEKAARSLQQSKGGKEEARPGDDTEHPRKGRPDQRGNQECQSRRLLRGFQSDENRDASGECAGGQDVAAGREGFPGSGAEDYQAAANGKLAYDIGTNVVDIVKSYNKAADRGQGCHTVVRRPRGARKGLAPQDQAAVETPVRRTPALLWAQPKLAMDTAYAVTAGVSWAVRSTPRWRRWRSSRALRSSMMPWQTTGTRSISPFGLPR